MVNNNQTSSTQPSSTKMSTNPVRSIEQLNSIAQIPFDRNLPIKSYIRSCEMLYQQAKINQSNQEIELAYIYLYRAARITEHDIPTHPEYELLPQSYRAQIKADVTKYLDLLAPIRAKLSSNYHQSTNSNSSSPGQSISTSLSTPLSTPTLNSSLDLILTTPPQEPYHHHHSHHHHSHNSLSADWTFIEIPSHEPLRKTSQPPSLPPKQSRTSRYRTSANTTTTTTRSPSTASSSSLPSDKRNPLAWPVELGNGLGQRMSVAPPIDRPSTSVRLDNRPNHSPTTRSSAFRHHTLYDLQDPTQSPLTTPLAPQSIIHPTPSFTKPPTSPKYSKPFSFSRFALSSDHLIPPSSSSHNTRSSAPTNHPPLSTSFRTLLRPRRLSWTASSKPTPVARRDSLTDWAPVSAPTSPSSLNPPPTTTKAVLPQPPPRSRKSSLGEPSSWRWLKNLKHSSSSLSHNNNHSPVSASVSAGIYADIPTTSPLYTASSDPPPPDLPHRRLSTRVLSQSHDENQRAGRPMKCPADLVGAFVAMAEPETSKGIELCGLLLGKLKGTELVVDTLLIPKQISTSNTCHTVDEAATFEFQNRNGLMTLGWIHTHPTQTCFMSSVDLHNHLSYQLMLPEAVAIVCSPFKEPSVGVYKLTDPHGISVIRECQILSDQFHPHVQDDHLPSLYTTPDELLFSFVDNDQSRQDVLTLDIVDLR